MLTKFYVVRKAVLPEDEGGEQHMGLIEAENEADAIEKVLGGSTYFKPSDFYAL